MVLIVAVIEALPAKTRVENKVFSDYARFWASLPGPDPSEAIAESAAKRLAQRFVSGARPRRTY